MAQQNQKTIEEQQIRRLAEATVDRYLKVVMSSDREAGWQGDNLIGRLIDFKGELPQSSGFSGFSKVWEQAALMNDWPPKFRVAVRLLHELSDRQREAVCVDRAYRGRTKVIIEDGLPGIDGRNRQEIFWSDDRCAEHLRCTASTFRRRICVGYRRLEQFLDPFSRVGLAA